MSLFQSVSQTLRGQSAPVMPLLNPAQLRSPPQKKPSVSIYTPDQVQLSQGPPASTTLPLNALQNPNDLFGKVSGLLQQTPRPTAPKPLPATTPAPSLPLVSSLRPKARPQAVTPQTSPIPIPTPQPQPRPTSIPSLKQQASPQKQPAPAALKAPGQPQTQGKQVFSRSANSIDQWFVAQFSRGAINPNADCGPAAVAMILRANGLATDKHLGTVRRSYMGVRRNGATASNELARGIEKGSGNRLKTNIVEGNSTYARNPQAMLNRMRQELKAGHQVILLTKNMASMKNGHYVVVQGIKANGDLVVADPGSTNYGKNREFSYRRFAQAFEARRKEGMPNNLIVVKR